MSKTLGFLVIALFAFVPTLWAAETPYDFVACFDYKFTPVETTADITAVGVEMWAIAASSTTKEWENATQHSVSTNWSMGARVGGKGLTKTLDSAGNSVVGETEVTAAGEGTFVFLSGTGKYKGIQGGGFYKRVGTGKPSVAGTLQVCTREWGKYTLP